MSILRVSCLVGLITIATGLEFYGECLKFESSEIQMDIPDFEWYCLEEDGFKYCRFYTCAWTNCDTPVMPTKGKCGYCPGTCSYGGKVYNVRQGFQCLDGTNMCQCAADNLIFSTRVAQHAKIMCKA